MPSYIYSLNEPDTNEIRYIGHTINLKSRLQRHMTPYYLKPDTYKNRWIKKLKSQGLKPVMEIIEEVTNGNWEEREIHWIAYYRTLGFNLVNTTDGGKGVPVSNPEIVENIKRLAREATLGISKSDEFIERCRINATGQVKSKETKDKLKIAKATWWKTISKEDKTERIKKMRSGLPENYLELQFLNHLRQLPETGSGYKGVYIRKNLKSLTYRVAFNRKEFGTYKTIQEAGLVYDCVVAKQYGEKVYLNFPDHPQVIEALRQYKDNNE